MSIKNCKESQVNIIVIGCGEAFDSIMGNSAYLLRQPYQKSVLFDCGYQIPERLWRYDRDKDIGAVFFSHLHADHFFGIIPLIARYWEDGRTDPLFLYGPNGFKNKIIELANLGYPGLLEKIDFELIFKDYLDGNALRYENIIIKTAITKHSIINHAIRIDFMDKEKSIAISGDGRHTDQSKKLICKVNLLLQEAYTIEDEMHTHSSVKEIMEINRELSLDKIGLAHISRKIDASQVKKLIDERTFLLEPNMTIPV
ncbi:MAG: ribonuclease Z [Desulfobacteraceae bacterium]|nr:ribonuclease Z [Desulfobacteraceae bacterium]